MGRNKKYGDELNPEVLELYRQGFSLSAIGKQMEMPPQVVKRKLIEMGEPVREASEAMKLFHKKNRET